MSNIQPPPTLALHRRCGSPRVHRELRAQGTRVSRKRIERVMRQEGLRGKRPRPFRVTTQSQHAHPVAPNLLQRRFTVPQLNRVWGADITYLPTAEGWLYLAVVLDLCSRRVIGWAFSDRLTQPLTLHALEMALALRGPCPGVLHHSDRGSQPGFNRSSQHGVVPAMLASHAALRLGSANPASCVVGC